MRKMIGFLAAAFLLISSLPALAEKPAGVAAEMRTGTATVEAVNQKTREVTLKAEDGGKLTFKAGPEVRNFAQVKVGDKVTATYYQELAVFVAPPGEAPSASETKSLERAALGKKPAGSYTRTVDISATVEALDLKTRKVTLRGPKGNSVTLKLGDHVKRLDKVKVGDAVVAQYTEIVEITVSKP
jgi:Cu/Ag efflux protein CusF